MKLDILQLHRLGFSSSGRFEQNLVIQAQSQFRHSGQIHPHFDAAHNFRPEDVSGGPGQKVNRLNDVEEDLVFPVFDTFGTPRNGVGDSRGRL